MEDDFSSLSLESKLSHKSWKARQSAYSDLLDKFKVLDLQDTDAWASYHEYLRAAIADQNQISQEFAVAALFQFVNVTY
jgi:hypothetical protein